MEVAQTSPTIIPMTAPMGSVDRKQEVYRVACDLFQAGPDWVTFFREVLGVDGIVRKVFSTPEQMEQFEASNEYAEIQQMLAKLRERTVAEESDREPTRVITVRMPKSLHESLRHEAHSRRTSMNKLCISKLLQVIAEDLIPAD
jgi:predicted HicB family RNase H-like nuclease